MSQLFPDYRAPWFDEDLAALSDHAAAFFAKELVPHQERFDEQHHVDRDVWTKAGAAGLLCLELPEQYGGAGQSFAAEAVITTQLALTGDTALGYGVHSSICAHYIYAYGTEEQRDRWLPGIVSGELVTAIAMTEPGTGSDLQSVRTSAVREGDDYVINGSKTFISNGTQCDLLIIVAKTDPSQGAKGISLIVAETADLAGFERGRVLRKIGQHGQDTRELSFTDMRVPAANLLGGVEGQGFVQLMSQLPRERLAIGITAVAAAELAVLEAIRYTKERKAFGSPILDYQNTGFVLAECKADVLAGRTMVDHCIQLYLDGKLDAATASMAKFWCSDMQCRVVDKCLQLFGGYGYMMEYPIARLYAAARVQKIYGGTNEIMKMLVARTL